MFKSDSREAVDCGDDLLFVGWILECEADGVGLLGSRLLDPADLASVGPSQVADFDFVGSAGPKPGFGSYFERNRWTAYFDRESIGNQLQVRTWIPGDRFQPLGMTGDKKLQDFFTDAQVPREWRKRIPLLVTEGGIAWVVGYRIADWARVKTDERQGNQAVEVVFTCEKETG